MNPYELFRVMNAPDEGAGGGGDPAGGELGGDPAGGGDPSGGGVELGGAEGGGDPETFPREYVEQLRRESQGLRQQLSSYNEAFGDYEPEVAETWVNAARMWREDPETVAKWMQEQATAYFEAQGGKPGDPGDPNDPNQASGQAPLTFDDVAALLDERDQQMMQAQAVERVQETAQNLGYDVASPDYVELLWFANNHTEGDIARAHQMVQQRNLEKFQWMIDAKAQASGGGPGPAPQGGVPTHERQIKDWKDSRRAAEERLNAGY